MSASIWWIRRDLRLSDNQALAAALGKNQVVIPVFILDPRLIASSYAGQKRLAFLFEGLRALDTDLRQKGSALIVRQGDPLETLHALCRETEAESIFAEADVSPYARRRDERSHARASSKAHPWRHRLSHPKRYVKQTELLIPYSHHSARCGAAGHSLAALCLLLIISQLCPISPAWAYPAHHSLFTGSSPFPAGEAEAQRRLDIFTEFDHQPLCN